MSWGIGDRVGVAVSAGTIATFNSRRPGPVPSLNLDFAGTGTLDPRVSFTRSTTGTYYNSSGVLTTAAINAPRFGYNPSTLAPLGLLIEQSSTNLLLYSIWIGSTSYSYSAANITPTTFNAGIAPDGTQTVTHLTLTSGISYNANDATGTYGVFNFTASTTYTWSVYAKAGELSYLMFRNNWTGGSPIFNLATGVVTQGSGTSSMIPVGNGWYRCVCVYTVTSGNNNICFRPYALSGSSNGFDGIYIWGAQLEALAFPTSYIPTAGSQVTRASDNASMTGTNFSSWYNISEGTLYCKAQVYYPNAAGTTVYGLANISNGSINTDIMLYLYSNFIGYRVTDAGSTQVDVSSGIVSSNTVFQVAAEYKVNNFAVSLNGATAVTDSVGSIPTSMAYLDIGSRPITSSPVNTIGNYINGHISKLTYYPTRLTNAQLQALTGS